MLKTEERKVDGLNVKVTQFAGRRNFDMLVDLANTAGPTIAAVAGQAKDGLDSEINIGAVADVLFRDLRKGTVTQLVRDLTASTFIEDRPLDDNEFDRVFAGPAIWKLPKVLAFVIEVNFGNFTELAGSVSSLSGLGGKPDKAPAN